MRNISYKYYFFLEVEKDVGGKDGFLFKNGGETLINPAGKRAADNPPSKKST